jgi:hypothetical protein
MHETYHGNDQIHAANGSSVDINRIGTSIIPTASRPLVLNKVLHVSPLFLLDQGSKHEECPIT